MADINASEPVVVPGTSGVTYDKWFLTQLISKVSPARANTIVHLTRAGTVDGKTVLMPADGDKSEVSFSVDIWKAMGETPELATAMEAVLNAVVVYATKKKLL
jgi:hypothetical protein